MTITDGWQCVLVKRVSVQRGLACLVLVERNQIRTLTLGSWNPRVGRLWIAFPLDLVAEHSTTSVKRILHAFVNHLFDNIVLLFCFVLFFLFSIEIDVWMFCLGFVFFKKGQEDNHISKSKR